MAIVYCIGHSGWYVICNAGTSYTYCPTCFLEYQDEYKGMKRECMIDPQTSLHCGACGMYRIGKLG